MGREGLTGLVRQQARTPTTHQNRLTGVGGYPEESELIATTMAKTLREWFDSLSAEGIEDLVGQPETPTLECKLYETGDPRQTVDQRNESLRKYLAEIVSGFANSEGGVCVWGLRAREREGVDRIEGTQPIEAPERLRSYLDNLTPHAVTPAVVGVEHRAIVRSDGRGYVATFVPESDAGPHMARFFVDRYMERSATCMVAMGHYRVADMFGRRARPRFDVAAVVVRPNYYRIAITNSGRGAMRAPYLHAWVEQPLEYVPEDRGDSIMLITTSSEGGYLYSAGMETVIHPTMTVQTCGMRFRMRNFRELPDRPTMAIVRFKVGALGIAPTEGTIAVEFDYSALY